MLPKAEFVHWWFATGFLIIGLLLFAAAALARIPLAVVRLPDGGSHVAGDGVLHQFDHSHARPRLVGAGDDARRRSGARARPRQATEPVLAALHRARVRRLGRGVPDPRAEQLAVRPFGLPASPDRLDARRRRDLPAAPDRPTARRGAADGLRARVRRPFDLPLLRPRRGAGVRPPVAVGWPTPPMRRLGLVTLLGLAFPATAFAHANLQSTSPKFRERVGRAPAAVVPHFDQSVQAQPNAIDVKNAVGKTLSGTSRATGQDVRAPLKRLPRGAYTVRWHVLSEDGHVVSGVFTFGVRVNAPPPTEAYGASGPTKAEHLVRWGYFLALALLAGGLGFRLLVVRGPLPRRAERRFFLVTGIGVVGVLELGIVAFVLRAEDALQLPFGRLLYGDLSPIANGTRFGTAFIAMTLG